MAFLDQANADTLGELREIFSFAETFIFKNVVEANAGEPERADERRRSISNGAAFIAAANGVFHSAHMDDSAIARESYATLYKRNSILTHYKQNELLQMDENGLSLEMREMRNFWLARYSVLMDEIEEDDLSDAFAANPFDASAVKPHLPPRGSLATEINSYYRNLYVERDVDIVTSRQARHFDIVKYDQTLLDHGRQFDFLSLYLENTNAFLSTFHQEGLAWMEHHFSFTVLHLVYTTIQSFLNEHINPSRALDLMDDRELRNFLYSFDITFLDDAPEYVKRQVLRRAHELFRNKGSSRIFEIILEIFGLSQVDLYNYYLIRKDNGGTAELRFLQVPFEERNVERHRLREDAVDVPFEFLTADDPLWMATEDELLELDFNHIKTKYVSLSSASRINEEFIKVEYMMNAFEANHIRHMASTGEWPRQFRFETNSFPNEEASLYDLLVALKTLARGVFGFSQDIPDLSHTSPDEASGRTFAEEEPASFATDAYDGFVADLVSQNDYRYMNELREMTDRTQFLDAIEDNFSVLSLLDSEIERENSSFGRSEALFKDRDVLFFAPHRVDVDAGTISEYVSPFHNANGTARFDTYIDYLKDVNGNIGTTLENILDSVDDDGHPDVEKFSSSFQELAASLEQIIRHSYFRREYVIPARITEYAQRLLNYFKSYQHRIAGVESNPIVSDGVKRIRMLDVMELDAAELTFSKEVYEADPGAFSGVSELDLTDLSDFAAAVGATVQSSALNRLDDEFEPFDLALFIDNKTNYLRNASFGESLISASEADSDLILDSGSDDLLLSNADRPTFNGGTDKYGLYRRFAIYDYANTNYDEDIVLDGNALPNYYSEDIIIDAGSSRKYGTQSTLYTLGDEISLDIFSPEALTSSLSLTDAIVLDTGAAEDPFSSLSLSDAVALEAFAAEEPESSLDLADVIELVRDSPLLSWLSAKTDYLARRALNDVGLQAAYPNLNVCAVITGAYVSDTELAEENAVIDPSEALDPNEFDTDVVIEGTFTNDIDCDVVLEGNDTSAFVSALSLEDAIEGEAEMDVESGMSLSDDHDRVLNDLAVSGEDQESALSLEDAIDLAVEMDMSSTADAISDSVDMTASDTITATVDWDIPNPGSPPSFIEHLETDLPTSHFHRTSGSFIVFRYRTNNDSDLRFWGDLDFIRASTITINGYAVAIERDVSGGVGTLENISNADRDRILGLSEASSALDLDDAIDLEVGGVNFTADHTSSLNLEDEIDLEVEGVDFTADRSSSLSLSDSADLSAGMDADSTGSMSDAIDAPYPELNLDSALSLTDSTTRESASDIRATVNWEVDDVGNPPGFIYHAATDLPTSIFYRDNDRFVLLRYRTSNDSDVRVWGDLDVIRGSTLYLNGVEIPIERDVSGGVGTLENLSNEVRDRILGVATHASSLDLSDESVLEGDDEMDATSSLDSLEDAAELDAGTDESSEMSLSDDAQHPNDRVMTYLRERTDFLAQHSTEDYVDDYPNLTVCSVVTGAYKSDTEAADEDLDLGAALPDSYADDIVLDGDGQDALVCDVVLEGND